MTYKSILFILLGIIAGWTLNLFWFRSSSWRRYKKNQKNHEIAIRTTTNRNKRKSEQLRDAPTIHQINRKIYELEEELWPDNAKTKQNREKWAYDASPRFGSSKDDTFYRQMRISQGRRRRTSREG